MSTCNQEIHLEIRMMNGKAFTHVNFLVLNYSSIHVHVTFFPRIQVNDIIFTLLL